MAKRSKSIAVFSGTFDPVTYGHLDLIERARQLFDKLIVAVGHNPTKQEIFTQQERVKLIRPLIADYPNVRVASYRGLTFDYVRSVGATVILRGIRDMADLRSELQQANTNLLVGNVETVFMVTSHDHALTSSELIRQIASLGGFESYRKKRLVPPSVAAALNRKLGTGRTAKTASASKAVPGGKPRTSRSKLPASHAGKGKKAK